MRALGLLVVVLCVCVSSPRVTLAQDQGMGASAVLSELGEGSRVRVLVPPDTVVEGNVANASARSLVLRLDDPGTAGRPVVDQAAAVESDGARQSPRGESEPPEPTFGPLGRAERLNWLVRKKRSRKTPSQRRISSSS